MSSSDIAAALAADAENVCRYLLPAGIRKGAEWKVGSIHGEAGESLSVRLSGTKAGQWADWSDPDEQSGDLVGLWMKSRNVTAAIALREAEEFLGLKPVKANGHANGHAKPIAPTFRHPKHGEPTATWCYRSPTGEVLGYVCRFDPPGERKEILPRVFSDGVWKWEGMGKPRPLYGLHELAKRPNDPVLVVEGEKSAEAAQAVLTGFVVVTWPGGAKAVKHADWSPLWERKVTLWPDADEAGIKAMEDVAGMLGKCVRRVDPSGQPDGWDVADAIADGMDGTAIITWCRSRVSDYTPPLEPEVSAAEIQNLPAPRAADKAQAWADMGLVISEKGTPVYSLDNCVRVLEQHPETRGRIWFDRFLDRVLHTWLCETPREWRDADDARLALWMQRVVGLQRVSPGMAADAIVVAAHSDVRNEAAEWIEAQTWDGEKRLESLMSYGFGAELNAYTERVGVGFMCGMVKRVLQPGCKFDHMLILEGRQGIYKSTALAILGGQWFAEVHDSVQSKDFFQSIQGKMLLEISEMHAFGRAEVERIKGVITSQSDRYRASYGRHTSDHPRQCIFAGTTNRDDWQRDETGGRRFWPIACGEIRIGWLAEMRGQLFAEARERVKEGEKLWDVPTDLAKIEQDKRRPSDTWDDRITDYAASRSELRLSDLLEHIGIELPKQDRVTQLRAGAVLRGIGWEPVSVREGSIVRRCWRRVTLLKTV